MRSFDAAFELCSHFSWLKISSNISSAISISYIAPEKNSMNWFRGQKLLIRRPRIVEGRNPIILAKPFYRAFRGIHLDIPF